MPNAHDDQPVYTDEEVRALLKRATELQAAARHTDQPGLSMAEVQQIAREIGIDTRYLQAAARDLKPPQAPTKSGGLLGAPMMVEVERIIPGVVQADQWEEIVLQARRTFNTVGHTSYLGKTLEWRNGTKDELSMVQITVSPQEDQTRINIYNRYANAAGLTYGMPMMLAPLVAFLITVTSSESLPLALLVVAVVFMVLTGAFRVGFRRWVDRRQEMLNQLMDQLEATVLETAPAAPAQVAAKTPAAPPQTTAQATAQAPRPLLDLDDATPGETLAPRRTQQRITP